MANTGDNLIDVIVGKETLMDINNCPQVPVEMGRAVYGSVQDDSGKGTPIQPGNNMQKQINEAVGFMGANSETAVWHFLLSPVVHHFVVVPWYKHESPHGQVYTVFMAYENQYSLGQYVHGISPAPTPGGKGYKKIWTVSELSAMFSDLLTSGTAWQEYFGQVGAAQATEIKYWKYKVISLQSAISNVEKYG